MAPGNWVPELRGFGWFTYTNSGSGIGRTEILAAKRTAHQIYWGKHNSGSTFVGSTLKSKLLAAFRCFISCPFHIVFK